ncbi:MAG: alpha/beta fold hydrolase [Thermoleophilaceae bacterium]
MCLHGFMDTWRVWELVLPALERRHDVLADAVESALDEAGFETAHIVGNSLGGYELDGEAARRRRASSGWRAGRSRLLLDRDDRSPIMFMLARARRGADRFTAYGGGTPEPGRMV